MTPYINPLEFIHQRTQKGIRFLLTDPGDSRTLRAGTPVTVSQPCIDGSAFARTRGQITAVGYVTATFTITETILDPGWPEHEETTQAKTPIYLAKENSFEPDPTRMLTPEQAERLGDVSQRHANILRFAPTNKQDTPRPPQNTPATAGIRP